MRRVPLLAAALAAAAVLTSCSTMDASTAARVNGSKIPDRVLEALATPNDDASGVASALPGEQLRNALSALIQTRIAEQIAAKYQVDLSAARAATLEQLKSQLKGRRLARFMALSTDEQNLVLDYQTAIQELAGAKATAPTDLEQRYTSDPASTGYFCIRFIGFTDESKARSTYAELAAGSDFAATADAIDPKANGGVASGQDGAPCVSLDKFRAPNVPAALSAALFGATPGKVLGPVRVTSAQGTQWYVLLHRPYAEISKDLESAVGAAPAVAEYYTAVLHASVSVSSKYGIWNRLSATVVPNP